MPRGMCVFGVLRIENRVCMQGVVVALMAEARESLQEHETPSSGEGGEGTGPTGWEEGWWAEGTQGWSHLSIRVGGGDVRTPNSVHRRPGG